MTNEEFIRRYLVHDSDSGVIYWTDDYPGRGRASHFRGKPAGSKKDHGYIAICVQRKLYYAHRIAWFLEHNKWPDGQIDHVNHVRDDNRICNLRDCTQSQNNHNNSKRANSSSGFKGVSFSKVARKWRADIHVSGKQKNLGLFTQEMDAAEAYARACKIYFGDFHHAPGVDDGTV